MIHKTEKRNREIFAARREGLDVEALAEQYNLSQKTVQQILLSERHKLEVSADPFYQATRIACPCEEETSKILPAPYKPPH